MAVIMNTTISLFKTYLRVCHTLVGNLTEKCPGAQRVL
jgi:hypothetical protein